MHIGRFPFVCPYQFVQMRGIFVPNHYDQQHDDQHRYPGIPPIPHSFSGPQDTDKLRFHVVLDESRFHEVGHKMTWNQIAGYLRDHQQRDGHKTPDMDSEVLEERFGDDSGESSFPVERPDRDRKPRHQRKNQAPPNNPQSAGRNEPDRPLQAIPWIIADQGEGQLVIVRLSVAYALPFALVFHRFVRKAAPWNGYLSETYSLHNTSLHKDSWADLQKGAGVRVVIRVEQTVVLRDSAASRWFFCSIDLRNEESALQRRLIVILVLP